MAEHSPLPWRVYEDINVMSAEEFPYGLVAECDMGLTGEDDKPALWKANAEHIVQCVNAHDELVAALHEIATNYRVALTELGFKKPDSMPDLIVAKAALARGRGEQS
jgi:hypothetical protein